MLNMRRSKGLYTADEVVARVEDCETIKNVDVIAKIR